MYFQPSLPFAACNHAAARKKNRDFASCTVTSLPIAVTFVPSP